MRETPNYDDLIIEFKKNKIDIEAIRKRPPWNFKRALAKAEKAIRERKTAAAKRKSK